VKFPVRRISVWQQISIAILSPCCAEFKYLSIHEMKPMVNPDNNYQICLVVRPIPVSRFGGNIEWKISIAVLSPCCAEFQYVSIHEMKHTANADNNTQISLLVRPIPVSRFGSKIELII
jgi:hypothetical protein